jgi:uncharacterized protein with PIN domain
MIVDTSAVIAIAMEEPGSDWLITALEAASWAGIGAPTAAETSIVLGNRVGF